MLTGPTALTTAAEAARRKILNCILRRVYRKQKINDEKGRRAKKVVLKE
jgi:hypothetical protein